MENLIVGIHGDGKYNGGQYNVLASFNVGVLKAFQNNFIDADILDNICRKGILPHIALGFNATGHDNWETLLANGVTNIMWSVDSIFFHNVAAAIKYKEYSNFVLFGVTPSDEPAIKHYFPDLNFVYMPHGVDPSLWQKKDLLKEHDIVFLSSLRDFETPLQQLKQTSSPDMYKLVMAIYQTAMDNPGLSFWDIYQDFNKRYGFSCNLQQYHSLFMTICYEVTHAKRVQMIKKLKNFNVKVWGSKLWEKYVEGNVQYMGTADLMDSIDIVNKSKIVLHLHPFQLSQGLHERVLNASAVGSFVISDNVKEIRDNFGDSLAYFNNNTMENLEDIVSYYLKNNEERHYKAEEARMITLNNHTWEDRAVKILDMLAVK